MTADQLLALQLSSFEVYRSGAKATMRCRSCGQRVSSADVMRLDSLLRSAERHVADCGALKARLREHRGPVPELAQ